MKYSVYLSLVLCVTVWGGCQQAPPSSTSETSASVEGLLQAYCGSCHQVPEPTLLPRQTWETHVLPLMGAMLGQYGERIGYRREDLLGTLDERKALEETRVFPLKPAISDENWRTIRSYYLSSASDVLEDTAQLRILEDLNLFSVFRPTWSLSPPSTTLTQFSTDGNIFVGDANSQRLYLLDQQMNVLQVANVGEGIVSLGQTPQSLLLTLMGQFSPTNQALGYVMSLPLQAGESPKVLIDSLNRPVHTTFADLDGNGLSDIIPCEYGKWTSSFRWFAQQPDGTLQPHVLRARPGATRVYAQDWDQDEDIDLMVLMAQGDEGIFYYENQGEGKFKERNLLSFPPSYGSSYFSLHDFNADGLPDILYTAGDNADYAPVRKPYHGIRIFLNEGDWTFKQKYFIPLDGAYKAIPGDFDGDGDWDLAAISFFPDYEQSPANGFVWIEQQTPGQFVGHTLPEEVATVGRWLTMDAGDPDRDGDLDIVLGSLTFEVPDDSVRVNQWVADGVPAILLRNQSKP